jgi:carboxyl-terminal processing protease
VPLDTSYNTSYLSHLLYRNAIREYTLDYYNGNREKLQAMTLSDFENTFKVTDKMLMDLVAIGESVGISYDEEQFLVSRPMIINRVKAFIARSVWNNEGWYRIANEFNEVYQAALHQFDEAEHLASAVSLRKE